MPLFVPIVIGLIAGFGGSWMLNKTGDGMLRDIALGVAGAIAGHGLFTVLGGAGASVLNPFGIVADVAGTAVLLLLYHKAWRREPVKAVKPSWRR